jgi:hypothetical protein
LATNGAAPRENGVLNCNIGAVMIALAATIASSTVRSCAILADAPNRELQVLLGRAILPYNEPSLLRTRPSCHCVVDLPRGAVVGSDLS